MKKPSIVMAATIILAIGAIGTVAGTLAAKNTPAVDSVEVKGAIFDPNYEIDETVFNPNEKKTESTVGYSKLVGVNRFDEERFSPEVWQKILIDIEKGEVYREESKE